MATKYNVEAPRLLDTLKATLMPKASNEEMMAFCLVANSYDLNPFTKEIYAFPNRAGGISPVVSVDGWMKLMNRQESFDGIDFECREENGKPVSVTATIHLKNRTKPVVVTEYFAECYRATEPWKSHPRRMLRHKALIQAARIAFGFSGISDEDEAAPLVQVTSEPVRPIFRAPEPVQVQSEPEPAPVEQIQAEVVETLQQQLAQIVQEAGHTFDEWKAFAAKVGIVDNDPANFSDVTDAAAKRCVSAKAGMLRALKGGAK